MDESTTAMKESGDEASKTKKALDDLGKSNQEASARIKTLERALDDSKSALRESADEATKTSARVKTLEKTIDTLTAKLKQLAATGTGGGKVSAFTQMKKDLDAVKGAMSGFMGLFKTFGGMLMAFKLPAIGTAIAALVQGVMGLGAAAYAVFPAIGALSSGLLALPGAAAVGIQGLSALKLGFSGVMQAVQAGAQAQAEWALNQREYMQQVTSANDSIITGTQGLSNAIYDQR
jgi:hypothetical protein